MKIRNKIYGSVMALATALSISACAPAELGNLEEARFCLDDSDYACAIENATAALSEDATNVEAARILASAYFGRSGLDFLEIAAGMLDLQDDTDSNFASIAAILPDDADLSDLRLAIETLEALAGIDDADLTANEPLADVAYDLSLMQMIEHFAIGVFQSGFKDDAFDVSGISESDSDVVQDDLIGFDNRMIASGVESDTAFISEVRQTFCILEPLSAGEGFTQTEYQALVGCQLEGEDFDTAAVDAGIADCSVLAPSNQDADVQACYDEDTSL